jgi:hypothetical protein
MFVILAFMTELEDRCNLLIRFQRKNFTDEVCSSNNAFTYVNEVSGLNLYQDTYSTARLS